jgi:hypothetical protein
VIDISDPSAPQVIGSLQTPNYLAGVSASGGHAYVTDNQGLLVVDLSDPTEPRIIGSADSPFHPTYVCAAGNYAYVTSEGLTVFDISDPGSPHLTGGASVPEDPLDGTYGVTLAAAGVCLTSDESGMQILPAQCDPMPVIDEGVQRASGLQLRVLPDPSPGQTTLRLDLRTGGLVRAEIYDLSGRIVRTLFDGRLGAESREFTWNRCDGGGRPVPAGLYLVRVRTAEGTKTAKLVLPD